MRRCPRYQVITDPRIRCAGWQVPGLALAYREPVPGAAAPSPRGDHLDQPQLPRVLAVRPFQAPQDVLDAAPAKVGERHDAADGWEALMRRIGVVGESQQDGLLGRGQRVPTEGAQAEGPAERFGAHVAPPSG